MLFVVTLMVDKPDAAVMILPYQRDVLLFRLPTVSARGAQDQDVTVRDTGPVQPLDQNRQIGAGLLPAAGHIRDQDANLLARPDSLLDGTGANGVVQRIFHVLPNRSLRQIHRVGVNLRHHLFRGQRYRKNGIAVLHCFHSDFAFCIQDLRIAR